MKPLLWKFTLPLLGDITFPAYFTVLTLGTYYPYFQTQRQAFLHTQTFFGNQRFGFTGHGSGIMLPFAVTLVSTYVVLGLCGLALAFQLTNAGLTLLFSIWHVRRQTDLRRALLSILCAWSVWQLVFGPGSERNTFCIIAPLIASGASHVNGISHSGHALRRLR